MVAETFDDQLAEDLQADEVGITECVVEMRLDYEANRAERNPSHARQVTPGYHYRSPSVCFENAGDCDAYVICPGNGIDCKGGRVKVDRHDLTQPRMPETTVALGRICTSQRMLTRQRGVLRAYAVVGEGE